MNYFDEVSSKKLQAYNRLMYVKALQEDAGQDSATDYVKKISIKDQKIMAELLAEIQQLGEPYFKQGLIKSFNPTVS